MKMSFQTGRMHLANTLERGDKYDNSVVHWLSTLPGEVFLVERKNEVWIVTTGQVIVDVPEPLFTLEIPAPASPAVSAKTKPKQPKKKKR